MGYISYFLTKKFLYLVGLGDNPYGQILHTVVGGSLSRTRAVECPLIVCVLDIQGILFTSSM